MPRKGFLKPSDQRREKRVHALFTEAELLQVQASAGAAGLTVSAYLRACSLGQKPKAKPSRVASEMVRELNRIGVNLHQLLKHANAGNSPHEDSLKNVLKELLAAVKRVA